MPPPMLVVLTRAVEPQLKIFRWWSQSLKFGFRLYSPGSNCFIYGIFRKYLEPNQYHLQFESKQNTWLCMLAHVNAYLWQHSL